MAGYNEILVGRYNRALQKLLSMKGGSVMNELGSVLMPSVNFFWGTEMRYLEGWNRFSSAIQVGAVPANNSVYRIRNPITSNVIAVFEKIYLFNQNAAASDFRVEGWFNTGAAGDLPTALTTFVDRFDARSAVAGPSVTVTSDNTAPAGSIGRTVWFNVVFQPNATADVIVDDLQELPLLPGDAMQVRNNTVNQFVSGIVWWRERALEDS